MSQDALEKRTSFLGIALFSMALLMYQVFMVRIFSVTMWYHYAFAAMSITLFGLAAGACLIYLFPGYFTQKRAKYHLPIYSLWTSLAMVLSFVSYLCIPSIDPKEPSVVDYFSVFLIDFVVAIPFVFAGVCRFLAWSRFPTQVSAIYGADLVGSGIACAAAVYVLEILDAPTAVLLSALAAAGASLVFSLERHTKAARRFAAGIAILWLGMLIANTVSYYQGNPLLKIRWVKGHIESPALYDRWNAFSHIQVTGQESAEIKPSGPGLSPLYFPTTTVKELHFQVDALIERTWLSYSNDLRRLEFLRHDVANFAYHIRPASEVLVLGAGGGRDILSALVFKARSIVGLEFNGSILNAMNGRFGEFTGHLDQDPQVRFIPSDARNYVERASDPYDLIQIPMLDTGAAAPFCAFCLPENGFYTVEAWRSFLARLKPDGILAASRWHSFENPWELYRLSSLGIAALRAQGVSNPRDHLALVSSLQPDRPLGVGTLLVSKAPFTSTENYSLARTADRFKFQVLFSPKYASSPVFENIVQSRETEKIQTSLPVRVSAPTDDSPFFLNMLKLTSVFDPVYWKEGPIACHLKAVFTLVMLFATAIGLALACITLPLLVTTENLSLRGPLPLFLYFTLFGLGFGLVEFSQAFRLSLFLGHPSLGLLVVLLSFFLSCGLGSFLTQPVSNPAFLGVILLVLLLTVLALLGVYTPSLLDSLRPEGVPLRSILAAGILFASGLFLGMGFPLGMKVAHVRATSLVPWLAGIHAAFGILASVGAVFMALMWGLSVTYWTGVGCLAAAFACFVWSCLAEGYSTVPGGRSPLPEIEEPIEIEAQPVEN
jgi:hypothetical protein